MLHLREEDEFPIAGVKAVAQCATTLELKRSTVSGISFLKSLLPLYTGPVDSTGCISSIQLRKGKEEVCDDLPVSRAEFETAWVDLCAFELESNAMLPTAPPLYGVWKSILSATMVKGLDLGDSFSIPDIVGLVEEDGFPWSLLQAVTRRLSMDQVVPMEGCESSTGIIAEAHFELMVFQGRL